MRTMMKQAAAAALACFAAFPAGATDTGAVGPRWVQLAPGGISEARLVTTAATCPAIIIDGASSAMRVRAAPDGAFNVRLCAATLPKAAKSVTVGGLNLPLLRGEPNRIVVIGDTGCRIKGSVVQACNDPAKWPFPLIAREAARLKPDLVLDVGDYLYREQACPAGDAACAGTPSGDNWPTWNADFFTPAAPLLAAAPWVIVRGNHEDCTRSGAGWLKLLGPLSFAPNATCADHLAPYAVPLGGFTLAVMDDANAPDFPADGKLVPEYAADFASLEKLASGPLWLSMHRPIWGAISQGVGPITVTVGGNRTLIDALKSPRELDPVSLMISGHIHSFELLDYPNAPPQIIAGNSGDNLDASPTDLSGTAVAGEKISQGVSLPGFGLLLMTRDGAAWNLDEYRSDGSIARRCRFASRRLDCGKA